MKEFPTLYKRFVNGAIQQWQIIVIDDVFFTKAGQVGGIITESKPTCCSAKNVGRSNSTTPEEQSEIEAASKFQKKVDEGYVENIIDIDDPLLFFKPQLAHKLMDYKDKVKYPMLASRKLDGIRMISDLKGLTSRKGKLFVSCDHIYTILKPIFDKHPKWVIDGEIYSHEVPFEKIVSLVRKTKPTKEDLMESADICQLWIFDGVIDDRRATFEDRFGLIEEEIKSLVGITESLRFVDNEEVNNLEQIEKLHSKYVSEGYEGIILRVPNAPYENKRSKNLLKYKYFIDKEFTIVDIEEGSGNRSGMAGRLILRNPDSRLFGCGIRGGEDYYRELLRNKDKYIGKQSTTRYQELTNEGIPRFPVSIAIRDYE